MLALSCLCGCSLVKPEAQLARLSGPSDESYRLIRQTIAAGLNQKDVLISKSMFLESSEVILEQRDLTGNHLNRGIKLRLMKRGDTCFVLRIDTNERWDVPGLACVTKMDVS